MLYDKLPGPPPPGSPLESIFILLYLERQHRALLAHRALIQAVLPAEKEAQQPAIKAFQDYCDSMFPFIEKAQKGKTDEVKALENFVKHRAKIDKRDIYKTQANYAKKMSELRKFQIQPKSPGAPYQGKKS